MDKMRNYFRSMIDSFSPCVTGRDSPMNFHRKFLKKRRTSFEEIPNELFLELFDYLTLNDIYTCFYGLNSRFNRLIAFSCVRGFTLHTTKENNVFLKHILPDIPPTQIETLKLWHNSSYDQLLNAFPLNLYLVDHLVLKRLKNVSFSECRQLLKHFKCLKTLTMIDFNTPKTDWLDDNYWNDLIQIDLPHLRHLDVRICVIYQKQIYEDDKDNIIYSYTSRYGRPTYRLYTGSLLRKEPILEICLTIDRVFPRH